MDQTFILRMSYYCSSTTMLFNNFPNSSIISFLNNWFTILLCPNTAFENVSAYLLIGRSILGFPKNLQISSQCRPPILKARTKMTTWNDKYSVAGTPSKRGCIKKLFMTRSSENICASTQGVWEAVWGNSENSQHSK